MFGIRADRARKPLAQESRKQSIIASWHALARNIGSSIKDSNSLLDQMGGLPSLRRAGLPRPCVQRCR